VFGARMGCLRFGHGLFGGSRVLWRSAPCTCSRGSPPHSPRTWRWRSAPGRPGSRPAALLPRLTPAGRARRAGPARREVAGRVLEGRGAQLRGGARRGVRDLPQLATANLAARYHDPLSVGAGALPGLWAVAALAITGGHQLLSVVPFRWITRVAAAVMIASAAVSLAAAITS
jgi:Uncharacterized protein family UPF0016